MIDQKVQIMEIERFAIHDGPGIRSVVFFQGCPLHCPWCANPESQQIKTHLFHSESKCTGCGHCLEHCPKQALYVENGHIRCDQKQCIHCNTCVDGCLQSALKWVGKSCSVGEILKEIGKDDAYYQESQGGVTLSGGEVFTQFSALKSLLTELKKRSYHICIETCGEFETRLLEKVLKDVDLFLFDMKHSRADKLYQVTGGHLDLIKHNIQTIAQYDPDHIIIRVPVIPGFNDDYEVIEEIVEFAHQNNISKVELLPFHNLGKSKYDQMGNTYQYQNVPNMKAADLEKYTDIFLKYHVHGIVGNKILN